MHVKEGNEIMYCQRCKAEYKEGVLECADCGVKLVESLEDALNEEETEFQELLETYNPGDIAMIKSILDEDGIEYYFRDENFTYLQPLVQPARLMVEKRRAEEARDLLKDLTLSHKGITGASAKRKKK